MLKKALRSGFARRFVVLVVTALLGYLTESVGVPSWLLPEAPELVRQVLALLGVGVTYEGVERTARAAKRRRLENRAGVLR